MPFACPFHIKMWFIHLKTEANFASSKIDENENF